MEDKSYSPVKRQIKSLTGMCKMVIKKYCSSAQNVKALKLPRIIERYILTGNVFKTLLNTKLAKID